MSGQKPCTVNADKQSPGRDGISSYLFLSFNLSALLTMPASREPRASRDGPVFDNPDKSPVLAALLPQPSRKHHIWPINHDSLHCFNTRGGTNPHGPRAPTPTLTHMAPTLERR